jgi:hypothetical protein
VESDSCRAAAVQRPGAPGPARPLVDAELFARAQRIVAERERSWRDRAANATDYLLTRFLRCGRCGYGSVGTAAHGNGGAHRYYTCFRSLKGTDADASSKW